MPCDRLCAAGGTTDMDANADSADVQRTSPAATTEALVDVSQRFVGVIIPHSFYVDVFEMKTIFN